MKELEITIDRQGAPVVNHGYIRVQHDNIAAVSIDMSSKYCEVIGTCGTGIIIAANERSIYLDGDHDRSDVTDIDFPQFKGWRIWAVDASRYTINICFVEMS